jgi:hypothetical protein
MAYEFYAGLVGGALVLFAFLLTSFGKLHRHTTDTWQSTALVLRFLSTMDG